MRSAVLLESDEPQARREAARARVMTAIDSLGAARTSPWHARRRGLALVAGAGVVGR